MGYKSKTVIVSENENYKIKKALQYYIKYNHEKMSEATKYDYFRLLKKFKRLFNEEKSYNINLPRK